MWAIIAVGCFGGAGMAFRSGLRPQPVALPGRSHGSSETTTLDDRNPA